MTPALGLVILRYQIPTTRRLGISFSSSEVKRVIGVGGDTVQCCDAAGHILVNGKPLTNETYIKPHSRTDQVHFIVLVPEGSIFVMGDNRGNSQDSRYHLDLNNGMVPLKDVIGRVVVKIWPFNRIGGIER